nr:putative gtpase-activating protein [Quercus suber]
MPIIWDHLVKNDVQLSVVSLPWFLSLYINSMPLIFAFRVLDVFFLEGPKVLFQVGLAILRVNGEDLLDASDDGTFISVLKSYFARLGESAHPKSENPKHRAITNFQALMVVAFKEFDGITQHTISEQRSKHKAAVMENIESFAKRTSIRNLGPQSKKLSTNDLGFLYDKFYIILYERQQRAEILQAETDRKTKAARQRASEIVTGVPMQTPEMGRVALGPSPTQMDYDAFRELLAGVAKWAVTDSPLSPIKDEGVNHGSGYFGNSTRGKPVHISPWGAGPEPAEHDFIRRLFKKWDTDGNQTLTLQNVVYGLAPIKGDRDIMSSISYFFELYDDDNDGRVDREGILRISEALLFLSRRGVLGSTGVSESTDKSGMSKDELFLSAVSAFIRRCFEYADPDSQASDETMAEEVDLLVLESDAKSEGTAGLSSAADEPGQSDVLPTDNSLLSRPSNNTFGQVDRSRQFSTVSANAALDPASPVHITLPTFRMLILADELLESFFDSGFANSFSLADAPISGSTVTSPSYLGLHAVPTPGLSPPQGKMGSPAISPGGIGAGVVGPGKGLRGMLDNIVTDGMRVAAEVRRRMDEAQREVDRGANTRGTEDDEDEDGEDGAGDLLEGAEAIAGPTSSRSELGERSPLHKSISRESGRERTGSDASKSTFFER